jgi:hypothetical protein
VAPGARERSRSRHPDGKAGLRASEPAVVPAVRRLDMDRAATCDSRGGGRAPPPPKCVNPVLGGWWNEAARTALHVRARRVVQPRRAVLRAVALDWSPIWEERVVDVEVELVERALQLGRRSNRTDLRTDRVPYALCVNHEVLVWRDVRNVGIGEAWPGEGK